MPLLLISGLPSSGKSTIASRLKEELAARSVSSIAVISDESADSEFSRDAAHFLDKRQHVDHNNMLRSEVRRQLATSAETLVIVDSLNYARSHRYEMCTMATNCRTKFAILHVAASTTTAEHLNTERPPNEQYAPNVLADLVARYEEIRPHLNGERPLFTVEIAFEDDGDRLPRNAALPVDEIYAALFTTNKAKIARTNVALTPSQKSSCSAVYEINERTRSVVEQIMRSQSTAGVGGTLIIDEKIKYVVPKMHTFASLARLRARFLEMARQGLVPSDESLTLRFVEFIASLSNSI